MRLSGVVGEVNRVGIDLDLTLINSTEATRLALTEVNAMFDGRIDIEEFMKRLGPPLRSELARYLPEHDLDRAIDVFRHDFLTRGVTYLTPMPGARDLLEQVHRHGGIVVVITSRILPVAEAALAACGLAPDMVIGGVAGRDKAKSMRKHDLDVYIGDHPLDMIGAIAADVCAVGVTSGTHDRAALQDAGAQVVHRSLTALLDG